MLVDVQTISIVIAATGVFIAAINQILSRRRTEKTEQLSLETRQAQLFMQLNIQWTNPDFARQYGLTRYQHSTKWKTPEGLRKLAYEPFNSEVFTAHHALFSFFEGLGVLVQSGLIDIN